MYVLIFLFFITIDTRVYKISIMRECIFLNASVAQFPIYPEIPLPSELKLNSKEILSTYTFLLRYHVRIKL